MQSVSFLDFVVSGCQINFTVSLLLFFGFRVDSNLLRTITRVNYHYLCVYLCVYHYLPLQHIHDKNPQDYPEW